MTTTPETRVLGREPTEAVTDACLALANAGNTNWRDFYGAIFAAAPAAPAPHHVDEAALAIARQYTDDNDPQRRAALQVAITDAIQRFSRSAAPAPEPVAWMYTAPWGHIALSHQRLPSTNWSEAPLYAAPPAPVAASAVDALRQAATDVVNTHGSSGHVAAMYRLKAALADTPSSPNPGADNPAGDPVVNAPRVRELEWSEPAKPCEECRYDHVKAQSGLGEYRIEWKGWKDDGDAYCYVLNDDLISCENTLEAAKAAAQADYERRVLACLEPGQGDLSLDRVKAAVAFAQRISLSDGYFWPDYMRDLWRVMNGQQVPPPPAAEGK